MSIKDIFQPTSEADRRQAISLTQAVLARVNQAVGDDVIFQPTDRRIHALRQQYQLHENADVFAFIEEHFRDTDVRAGLGVDVDNAPRVYGLLHCLNKALSEPTPQRRKLVFR